VGFVVDKVALGQGFLRVPFFFSCQYLSTGAPYSGVSWGMNNRFASGCSLETYSHPIDMKKKEIIV
jgi:hypothetical protein